MGRNTLDAPAGGAPSVPVKTTTLDEVISKEPVDSGRMVVKIDAEGNEIKVLRGFRKTLSGTGKPFMVVEAYDPDQRRAGASNEQLVQELESLDYRLFEIEGRGLRPLDHARLPEFANLVALPPGKVWAEP
jgi:hypothetical protein